MLSFGRIVTVLGKGSRKANKIAQKKDGLRVFWGAVWPLVEAFDEVKGMMMSQVDHALAAREAQLKGAYDLLVGKYGEQSEPASVVRARLDDVREKIVLDNMSEEAREVAQKIAQGNNYRNTSTLPKVKDSAVMFVIIGAILIVALGGMSTMFVLMLAISW